MHSGYSLRFIAILLVFLIPAGNVFSATYYSRLSGNWNNNTTWSTDAVLQCNGAAATTVPGAGDNVVICAGHVVTMNGNPGSCLSLSIYGTASWGNRTTNVGSGGLFMSGGTITGTQTGNLTVAGNFTMSGTNNIGRINLTVSGTTTVSSILNLTNTNGAKIFTDFIVTSSGTFNNSVSENITLNGNFQNNGSFVINSGRVTFRGAGQHTVTGSSTTNFNTITVDKGTSSADEIDVQSAITLANGGLTLLNGTFKISNSSVSITPFTADITAAPFLIPATAALWCNGGTINSGNMNWTVAGTLRVSAGTVNVGNTTNNLFMAENSGTTQLIVEGGTLNVAGAISRQGAGDYITFSVSAGTVVVPSVGLTTVGISPIQIDQASTSFTMSGGTIDIPRSGAGNLGFTATAGTAGISGGVIQIGDASSPAGQVININSSYSLSNVLVNSSNVTARLAANLTLLQALTISSGTFDANNFILNLGGQWTNSGTFVPGTGTVNLNGTGTQMITRTGGETFYNFTVNKPSGSVLLVNNVTVTNTLTMTSGNIDCQSYTLTLGTSVASTGTLSHTSGTIIGNFNRWKNASAGSLLFPIGTSTYYRPALVTFTSVTGGTLAANFISSDPGSNGLPLSESGKTISSQFTEGFWDLTAANGLTSTNFAVDLTGNGFTSYPLVPSNRILYRALAGNPWSLNGTHVAGSGSTSKRSAMSGIAAQYCFGKTDCSTFGAVSIAGNTSVCVSTSSSYSVTNTVGNSYTWVITGGSVASGQGTNSISVNWGASGMIGNVQVTEQNDCGNSNSPINLSVYIHPIATSTITGATNVSTNETGVSYSVTATPGYSYNWTFPSGGGSIASGQGTNSVSVNWGATPGTYTLQVTATRLCGSPDVQNLPVIVRAPFYSRQTGNWGNAATWSNVACGSTTAAPTIPGPNDEVIICAAHTVTMNGNPGSCRKLTINGTANWTQARTTNVGSGGIMISSTGNITGSGSGVLTSTGGLTGTSNSNISSTTVTIRLQTNPQNITCDGALNILDVTTTVTNTGTVTIANNGTLSGSGTFAQGGNSLLNMNGSTFSVTNFNASASGNTVNYGSNASQTIKAGTYNHLTVSGTGTKTLEGATTVNGNLTISSAAATFDVSANNYTLSVGGNWTNNGTFNRRFGTVTFNGSSTQTISSASGLAFHNLIFSGSGTKQISNNLTIEFDFTNSSTFNAGTNSITAKGNWDNSGTISLNNDVTFSNNSIILGSSTTTFNNVTITGTLAGHSTNMNVVGNWINNGTFNHNNGTVTFNGTTTISGTGTSNFGGVTISGTLNAPSGNINIAKNFTNNGTFNHNNGTVTFNGTAAQNIGGTVITDFYGMTHAGSGGLSLAQDVNLIDVLSITSGTFTTTGYNFTLKSTASRTARIAPISAGANISGNIIHERYSGTGPTDWRFLCSSVSGNTLQDWNNEIVTSGFTGSDFPSMPFVSIWWYDETQPGNLDMFGFQPATNVTDPVVAGRGYWVYLGPNPVTFNSIGNPYKFSQSPTVTYTNSGSIDDDGWNLVANPYPSAIDWDNANWTKSNLDNAIYVYNSSTGSYASYVGGVGTNGGSRYIASQQAFYVKANAASPSLGAVENVKASTNPSHLKMAHTPNTSLYPMAFKDFPIPQNTNNNPNSILLTASGGGYDDETFIQFTPAGTNDFDETLDAFKLFGSLNLTSVQDDTIDYSINRMPALTSDVSVKLRLTVPATGTYSIRRDSILMLPLSSCIFLEDLANGNMTDLRQNISYTFSISDTVTVPRFMLHIYAPIVKKSFPVSCYGLNNGMAIATGTGTGPWNYVWKDANGNVIQSKNNVSTSDTLFNQQAGIYTVEVSGAACGTVSDTITISSPAPLEITASFTDVSCNGMNDGTAFVSVAGGTQPYSYLWSNGSTALAASGLATGDYTITITDANGCTATLNASVSAPVDADFILNKDTLYLSQNDTAFFTNNSSGALFYQWNFGDLSPADSSLNPFHYYSASGTYTVTLIASDSSCYDTISYTVVVLDSLLTSVTDAGSGNNFSVYYSSGEILLSFDLKDKEDILVAVYDILGKEIYFRKMHQVLKNVMRLNAGKFLPGTYFVTVTTTAGLLSRKLIIPSR